MNKKLLECESNNQGVSNLFDEVEKQTKTNTRNIIHQDIRIKKLETIEKQPVQNQGHKVCALPVNWTATNLYIYYVNIVNSIVCILYLYTMLVYEKIKIDNNDEINRLID